MSTLGIVESFERLTISGKQVTRIKLDTGGSYYFVGELMLPPGIDTLPMKGDTAFASSNSRTGGICAVGFQQTDRKDEAEPGDLILYSRNAAKEKIAVFSLLKDGSISFGNGNGLIAMDASGVVTINGVTFDQSGNITTAGKIKAGIIEAVTSLIAALKELVGHVHPGVTSGESSTGPNT